MRWILDSSVFFLDRPVEGEAYTTPSVVEELRDLRSKCRLETMLAGGLIVREPSAPNRTRVRAAARDTGDAPVLSSTDVDVLALALEMDASVVTDDFAVQNVAHRLQVPVEVIQHRRAKFRQWKYRCSGCGRYFKNEGVCEFCGAAIKRKLK
jgi:UPF0271 protein